MSSLSDFEHLPEMDVCFDLEQGLSHTDIARANEDIERNLRTMRAQGIRVQVTARLIHDQRGSVAGITREFWVSDQD